MCNTYCIHGKSTIKVEAEDNPAYVAGLEYAIHEEDDPAY